MKNEHPRAFLGRNPQAKQWSKLSTEMLTVSKRRTVGLNEIGDGIQRGYEMPFWLMGSP